MAEIPAVIDTEEGQRLDRKSLRVVQGASTDFEELAKDCVCFANGSGGQLLIGIEDDASLPPPGQCIESRLLDRIRKRVGELTVNVTVIPEIQTAVNGGQLIILTIQRAIGVASTCDGRFYMRIGDDCKPILGDEVLRLANDRPSFPWETLTTLQIPRTAVDPDKLAALCSQLRASDRVKASVKEQSDQELLDHYTLASGDLLTNLGVLLLGLRFDRARLGTAPVIQAICYDEQGVKVNKFCWDDHNLSPIELPDAIWAEIPDFRESYEFPEGMFRTQVPAYEEAVVRELLVNALVHRPYTQRGDIYLNLHPDRLEVVNVGRLPIGVTPSNILHTFRRRNDGLTRIFHDLRLMEREGTGFDLMYEKLLVSGRSAPGVREDIDSVHVTIPRRVLHPAVIRLIALADERHQLGQRERITLGTLAQSEGMLATELATALELEDPSHLRHWLNRLLELQLVRQTGRTRATRYFVDPALLQEVGFDHQTTLRRIEPHRLRALIEEDVNRYPGATAPEIRSRVAPEIPASTLRDALQVLVTSQRIRPEGERRWRRYFPADPSLGPPDKPSKDAKPSPKPLP
jgi:ATP-dependent DNA helicase RecG